MFMSNKCPSFESIKLAFLILFAISFCFSLIFLLVITFVPSNVKFYISDASLTKFKVISNNTLDFKFEANITSRNPNKNVEIYYLTITAIALYKDYNFATVNLSSFNQGHKNTTFINLVFEGKSVLKDKQLFEYNEESRLGIYNDFAIDLDLLVMYKFGIYKTWPYNPPFVKCRRLSLSLISNSNSSPPSFHVTKCITGYFFGNR
ncbi:unnamed protein product [Lathyrus sativus]|nr:unnamed protein product [Lathyrus sativus]